MKRLATLIGLLLAVVVVAGAGYLGLHSTQGGGGGGLEESFADLLDSLGLRDGPARAPAVAGYVAMTS